MLGAFLIECTARNLAVSAERVGVGMDRLRQAQDRLRSAFRESDFLLEAPDGPIRRTRWRPPPPPRAASTAR